MGKHIAWAFPNPTKKKKKKKPHKYGAKKATAPDGSVFPSRLECRTYMALQLLEKAGEIKILKKQDNIYLTAAKVLYIPDFLVMDLRKNEKVWVEAKGFETDTWRIKRRLWKVYGPGTLWVYRKDRVWGASLAEVIVPKSYKIED